MFLPVKTSTGHPAFFMAAHAASRIERSLPEIKSVSVAGRRGAASGLSGLTGGSDKGSNDGSKLFLLGHARLIRVLPDCFLPLASRLEKIRPQTAKLGRLTRDDQLRRAHHGCDEDGSGHTGRDALAVNTVARQSRLLASSPEQQGRTHLPPGCASTSR